MNLIEVARRAGVSKSTVSRVLNNKANVAPETVQRVREVVAKLGYEPSLARRRGRPSKAASGLRTGTFALFFPDVDANAMRTALSSALAHGIEEALYAHNLSLMLAHLRDMETLPPCFARRQIDGAMIRGGDLPRSLLDKLLEFPCVWIFGPAQPAIEIDQVLPDNRTLGEMAFAYLRERGCQRLLCLNPAPAHQEFRHRCAAFAGAAERCGLPVVHAERIAGESTIDLVERVLGDEDGVFMPGHDTDVEMLCRWLASKGRRPGGDLAVIAAINDLARLRTLEPALPCLDIQPEEIGRSAVELLLWRLSHEDSPPRQVLVSPVLRLPD